MLTSSRPVPGYGYCNYSLTCYVHRQYRISFPLSPDMEIRLPSLYRLVFTPPSG